MKMEKTVCNCYNVTIQDIADAIHNGASDLDQVKEVTSASTCCGACEEYLGSVVEELLRES